MADCPSFKIDSNDTGLRYAKEKCLKQLPAAGVVWLPLEPDSYNDFGSTTTTVARNPINPSRQRRKGVVTDKDATAGFTSDMTTGNHQDFLQGFMFANAKELGGTDLLNSAAVPVGPVTATEIGLGAALNFAEGDIVLLQGYAVPANNGVKVLGAINLTTATVAVGGVAVEANPPATAKITRIGKSGAVGVVKITVANGVNSVTLPAGTGLEPGDWFFLGGGADTTNFANNRGFARVVSINGNVAVFDKQTWGAVTAETGTGKSISVMVPTIIKNQSDKSKIVRHPFQFERTLGNDANGVMSQYVIGNIANELTVNVSSADKVTMELGFVACDSKARSGLEGVKPGTRPGLVQDDGINTSSDIRRMAFFIDGESLPLFVYATEMTLTVNNNASGAKAIGVLGNFDINVGTFEAGGSVTAYFQDVRVIKAVEENTSCNMDIISVKNNQGMLFELPLITLGNGMLNVESDSPITVPLDVLAAESKFGHTMLYAHFAALPDWA